MNLEQIKDSYFNYLANEVLESIMNADRYNCRDFEIMKLDLILKLHKLLDTRENFNERIKILRLYDKNKL